MKKKAGPVGIAVILILLVAVTGVAWKVVDRYIPSREVMDPAVYFGVTGEGDAAIVMPDHVVQNKALVKDGTAYIEYETVKDSLNDHFYCDEQENQMILTTATDIIKIPYDSAAYTTLTGNGTMPYQIVLLQESELYIALDFIQQYTNLEYTIIEEPLRIILNNQWGTKTYADVKKEENVRTEGGIKSPVLTKVTPGDKVTVLEQTEEWMKVLTADGYIGYVRKKALNDTYEQETTHYFDEIVYTSIHKDYDINLIWHQISSQESNQALEMDIQDVTGVNVISPTWFSISTNDGDITSLASEEYVALAHEKGMEVWGLLDNFSADIDTVTVLGNTASREKLEDRLITEAVNCQMDGINIDIEALKEEASESYVQFMREMSVKCRNNSLVLSVDVPPPYDFNAHYNRAALGEVVDYVIVMGYDEHYVGSDPGSVASLSFERDGITGTLQEVPKDKIISGIPFYTRLWKTSPSGEVSSEAIGMNTADEKLAEYQVEAGWSQDTSQEYAEFTDGEGNFCQIWLENEASIEEKMKLVKEYDLAGAAAWKLGFERASIWAVISDYLD